MSRIIKEDFEGLLKFVKDYSLDKLVSDREFKIFLSTLHKKFYSFLVLIEELRLFIDNNSINPIVNKNQFEYLQESVSDCGQCLFLAINGCYKGSRLLLRSSIENFLKGICMDEIPQIITEKSVFQVFDDAALANVFKDNNLKDELHSIYGDLCMDVHTADSSHMTGVTAMRFFPHFNIEDAKKLSAIFIRLLPIFVTVLCLKFNGQYHSINYSNKEVISASLIDVFKSKIFGE